MKRLIPAALVATLMAAAAVPTAALAQNYNQRNQNYVQDRAEYERQMREYDASRARYERDRAAYDRRYGQGAYARYYGNFRDVAPVYRDNRYDNGYANNPYARYANTPCEQGRRNVGGDNDRTGGTVLGALIGGALGAVAAGDSSETEGAILGALVGGAIGNSAAGNSDDRRYVAACDNNGYYYTYDQTIPYRENARQRNGRYDSNYYSRQRCRLAAAPYDGRGRVEYRYVRVCPDRNNRYRFTS